MPITSKPVRIREAHFQDYSQIAALTTKFHLQTEAYDAWKHLWEGNPIYRELEGKLPMGWVLETANDGIAGYLGNIPLSYEFEGKKLLAATTRAWVTDTAYRIYSPLLLGTYFQQSNVDLFLNTTVNSLAAPAYDNFKSARVPIGAWDRTLFWITNYQGFTESLLRKKSWTMAASMSYPISAGVWFRDQFKRSHLPKNHRASRVVSCTSFDERFDAFWSILRQKKFNILLAVRNRDVLEWHFKFALLQNAAWIYTIEDGRGLAAYSVFVRQDSDELGLSRVRLADFQCLDPENAPILLISMLQAASDRCRKESIHMLELIGLSPLLEKEIEQLSPHRRLLPNWLCFYKANDRFLAARLQNPAVWEPSLFDGDSAL